MIKIIFITDTHGKASNPSARLDDFPNTLLDKIKYVGEFAKEIKASAVIHGGDWVESPDVSENYISKMVEVIKENYNCPIYSIVGNHDIYGYNPSTFERTPLAIAKASGVFKRLFRSCGVTMEGEAEAINITGQDAIYDLDKGTDYYYTDSFHMKTINNKPVTNIHVVHGLLSDHKWPVAHTVISDISKSCNADIILTGHDHVGYGLIRENNKIFCNPGSLSRTTASVGDVRRDVRLAVITIDKENFDVEIVNLPSSVAKSSNEVINRIKLEEIKKSKEQIDNFIVHLNNQKVNLGSNIYDAASDLAGKLNVSDEIFDKSKEELEKAEELLKNE